MALYDGFFDAVLDEDTYQYDREYDSGSFTEYYANLIGSGVCIHNNTDSMLVTWDGTAAVMAPGYLFIDGHWLKNTANYSVPVSGEGTYAILATLNMGTRRIEVETQPKADPEEYPDSLCLAYVTIDSAGAATVEDTRYNTDICGVIDTAGALSGKIEYVINYIDNEINAKLEQAEADIAAQAAVLDAKVAEVSAMVEKLAPPPIGTVKFSASSEIEDGWLRCDGSFISETDYPELVAALGKKYPSGDKFVILSDGEIGTRPTNMVLYEGRAWTYSDETKTLYGVTPDGETKSIPLTSSHSAWKSFLTNTEVNPIILSIVPHKTDTVGAKLCIAQVLQEGKSGSSTTSNIITGKFLLFGAEFAGEESSLEVNPLIEDIPALSNGETSVYQYYFDADYLPFAVSRLYEGKEIYYCLAGGASPATGSTITYGRPLVWTDESTIGYFYNTGYGGPSIYPPGDRAYYESSISINTWVNQRLGYAPLNDGEAVGISGSTTTSKETAAILSSPVKTYAFTTSSSVAGGAVVSTPGNMTVVGNSGAVFFPSLAKNIAMVDKINDMATVTELTLSFPSAARTFLDAGCYLWGKDIYFFFVGTGIVFFRDLDVSAMGYLDTTSVMGTITQFGNIRYSQDESTLYLMGQDTTNKVVLAKIVLNTLFDYANDGAWLPLIASDGVPAYIKALDTTTEEA